MVEGRGNTKNKIRINFTINSKRNNEGLKRLILAGVFNMSNVAQYIFYDIAS